MSDDPAVTLPKDPDTDELTLNDVAEFLRCNSDWELETATFRFTGADTNSESEWEPGDNRLITDGGNVETELDKAKRAREMFTCRDCGEVADARVDAENVGQMMFKTWATVHTADSEDGERTEVYVHFREDEVDRGAGIRKALDAEDAAEPEPDPHPDREGPDSLRRMNPGGRR